MSSSTRRQRFHERPCEVTVRRGGVSQLCFVDMDTFPNFFAVCDEAQSSITKRPMKTLYVCFLSAEIVPDVLQRESFYTLFSNQRVELKIHSGNTPEDPFTAQRLLLEHLSFWHKELPQKVKFTVLGGNHGKTFATVMRSLEDLHRDLAFVDMKQSWTDDWYAPLMQRVLEMGPVVSSDAIKQISTKKPLQ